MSAHFEWDILNMESQNVSLRSWLIWGIAAIFVLYQFLLQASTSVMIPCLESAFGISIAGVGFLSASFFYSYMILQIPGGLLTDRYGARIILTICIFLSGLMSFLFGLSHQLIVATIARLLMGVVTAPAVAAALYLAANWFPPKRFALLAGLTEGLGMFGGAIGEAMLAQCVGAFGWRNTMYLCGAFGLLLSVTTWFIIRDKRVHHQHPIKKMKLSKQINLVIDNPQTWFASLYGGLVFAIIAAFAAMWCVPYLQIRYHVDLTVAADCAAMIFVGTIFGGPISGWISNQIKRRKPVMMVGSLLSSILLITLLYVPISFACMIMLLTLLGFFCGVYVIPFALVGDITCPEVRATAMGFTNMICIVIGAPILQPLIGWLLKHNWNGTIINQVPSYNLHDYNTALLLLPVSLILSCIIIFFIKETHCKQQGDLIDQKDINCESR